MSRLIAFDSSISSFVLLFFLSLSFVLLSSDDLASFIHVSIRIFPETHTNADRLHHTCFYASICLLCPFVFVRETYTCCFTFESRNLVGLNSELKLPFVNFLLAVKMSQHWDNDTTPLLVTWEKYFQELRQFLRK